VVHLSSSLMEYHQRFRGQFLHTEILSASRYLMSKMLQSGGLLNDQGIHGYIMNLLGTTFGGWLGLRVVSTHFYAKKLEPSELVGMSYWQYRHKLGDWSYYFHTNFSWPKQLWTNNYGHRSNLLINHLASKSLPGGLRFYADSLESAPFSSEEVGQALEKTPLLTASNMTIWTVASSPIQSDEGNECGAWQCIKFTVYMKAALNHCLHEESLGGSSGVTFELPDNMSV
jgi:hypothetical protein